MVEPRGNAKIGERRRELRASIFNRLGKMLDAQKRAGAIAADARGQMRRAAHLEGRTHRGAETRDCARVVQTLEHQRRRIAGRGRQLECDLRQHAERA